MLTGNTRFRTNIFGRLILQVEVVVTDLVPLGCTFDEVDRKYYRDATVEDITTLKLKVNINHE